MTGSVTGRRRPPASAGNRWLARPRRAHETTSRMFCVPHVGAGAAAFNPWIPLLPAEVELCGVRLPGRESRLREPLAQDWREVVDSLQEAVTPLLDLPYVLLGHCSGSVLTYELARRLVDAGNRAPEIVVLSSAPGPSARRIDEPLHLLPHQELLEQVVAFGGMPAEILDDPELMTMFEPILRADYRVIERLEYSTGKPLDAPITVIGGKHDEFVSEESMAAWATETSREFSLHLLDAGHYILNEAGPLVADVVRPFIPGADG